MLKLIFYFVFFAVGGWLVYTQVLGYGTQEEKDKGAQLLKNAKNTFQDIYDILANQGQKIKNGDYNKVLDKMTDLLQQLKQQTTSEKDKKRVEELMNEEKELREHLEDENQDPEKTKNDLEKLTERIAILVEELQKKD